MIRLYVPPVKCQQCEATKRALDQRGLPYEIRQVDDYPEEADRLKMIVGRTAPLVQVGDDVWGGYRPDLISKLQTAQ